MSSQNTSFSQSHATSNVDDVDGEDTLPRITTTGSRHLQHNAHNGTPIQPPPVSSFWSDRLFEFGLILSMALYYIVGNPNIKLHLGAITQINPLFSLPFLLLFGILCWYRLPFALALFPLTLPYYLLQKTIIGNTKFSLAEITIYTCLLVALLQIVVQRRRWAYKLSLADLRARFGPFAIPMLVFFVAALLAIFVAYERANASRAFREEVFAPYLFVVLACFYLRTRQDLTRLLLGLFSTGLLIALIGVIQYVFFKDTIIADVTGLKRITTVYGSANSIALLADYTLPIGVALILARRVSWKVRLIVCILCLPFFFALSQSDSRGGWIFAIPVALAFIVVLAIRNRKVLLAVLLVVLVVGVGLLGIYHNKLYDYILNGHTSKHVNGSIVSTQSTVTKRLYLWESAWNMIHDNPWLGYGMDNWLCHYSDDWTNACLYPAGTKHPESVASNGMYIPGPRNPKVHAYWITVDPVTHQYTGLSDEPNLSHPHNIFLHVWVSIGIFGLLAFIGVLVLFYWLFVRLLLYLRQNEIERSEQLRWMIVGVGAAMLAALIHGQFDSAFLEQDLSFCFWMLVASLLILRSVVGMPWRALLPPKSVTQTTAA